jgi:hypothetical protein
MGVIEKALWQRLVRREHRHGCHQLVIEALAEPF